MTNAFGATAGHAAMPNGPALIYIDSDGTHQPIDADEFDPAVLSNRDRLRCLALLEHAADKLDGTVSEEAPTP